MSESPQQPSILSQVRDNLPLLTLLLVIICLIKLFVFYAMFGIDISDYIEITEVVSLLAGYLISITLVTIVVASAIVFAKMISSHKKNKVNVSIAITLDNNAKDKRVGIIVSYASLIIGIALLALAWYRDRDGLIVTVSSIGGIILFFVILVAPTGLAKMYRKTGDSKEAQEHNLRLSNMSNTFIFILLLIEVNVLLSVLQAYKLKYYFPVHHNTTIEYEGKLIQTSSTYVYIGRTKGYTFFYNRDTEFAHVYPNSGIKRIYMKRNLFLYPW